MMDSDPREEEPEDECPECQNILTRTKIGVTCDDCGFYLEHEMQEPDYEQS